MRQFSDLNLIFSKHPVTHDVTKKFDEEAIKASVRNLVSTKNYERPFHPEIGSQVYNLLFENFSPVVEETMKKTIYDVIEKFEPRVVVTNVVLRNRQDTNEIETDIIFKIANTERPIILTTAITRLR